MSRGIKLDTFEDLARFAEAVVRGGMRVKSIKNAAQAACIIQYGAEVGLGPMAAIKCITIKGDVPTIDGDGAMALVQGSDVEVWTRTGTSGEGKNVVGWCETMRKGMTEPVRREFTYFDAEKAGLLNRGLKMYERYPQRMFKYRAVGFLLRDVYADVLQGLHLTEEIEDDSLDKPACVTPRRADRRQGQDAPAAEPVQPQSTSGDDKTGQDDQQQAEPDPADSTPPPAADGDGKAPEDGSFEDATTVVAMCKGLFSEFMEIFGLERGTQARDMFVIFCAEKLACKKTAVDDAKKFTVPMCQTIKTELDIEASKGS